MARLTFLMLTLCGWSLSICIHPSRLNITCRKSSNLQVPLSHAHSATILLCVSMHTSRKLYYNIIFKVACMNKQYFCLVEGASEAAYFSYVSTGPHPLEKKRVKATARR